MAVNHYFQGGKGIGNQAEKRLHEDIYWGLKILRYYIFLVHLSMEFGLVKIHLQDLTILIYLKCILKHQGFAENEIINKSV